MMSQPTDQTAQCLWRQQATQWLGYPESDRSIAPRDPAEDDHDPDPPPAAPGRGRGSFRNSKRPQL